MQHYQAQSFVPYLNHGFPHSQPNYSSPMPARSTMDNIGEGDIATVLFPDGSTRYFFVPARNPAQIQPFNPNIPAYSHPYWLTNSGVWFVRSISNAVPLSVFYKFLQEINGLSHSETPSFFSSGHENAGTYQLKFHHDTGTSTSDLYCFCPVYSPFANAQRHPYYAGQQCPHFVQPSPFFINSPPCAVQPLPSYAVQPPKPTSNVGTNITTNGDSKAVQINLPNKENDRNCANMSTSNIPEGKSSTSKSSDRDLDSACTRKTCKHMMVSSNDEIATHSKVKKKSKCQCKKIRTSNKSCTTYNTQSTTYMMPEEKKLQTSMEDVTVPGSGQKPPIKETWIAVSLDRLSLPGTSRTARNDDIVLNHQSSSKAPINVTSKYIPKGKEYNAEPEVWSLLNRRSRIIRNNNNALHCSGTFFCNSAVKPNETVIWTAVNPLAGMEIGSSISALDLCESVSSY